jgi:hypothetical protein
MARNEALGTTPHIIFVSEGTHLPANEEPNHPGAPMLAAFA